MRARYIFEVFTQDSDPIVDMGIGMIEQIKKWMNTRAYYHYENIDQALYVCARNEKEEFVKYLLDAGANIRYDHDELMRRLQWISSTKIKRLLLDAAKKVHPEILKMRDSANKLDLIEVYKIPVTQAQIKDIILNIKTLSDKLEYARQYGVVINMTHAEELLYSCKTGDFNMFKDAIKNGAKVKKGHVNSLFKSDYHYERGGRINYTKLISGKKAILDYLRSNISNLSKIAYPKDKDKIEKLLNIKPAKKREYPRGYKIYRLIKYIDENKVSSVNELVKFIYEITYGLGTFNSLINSSYWKDGFDSMVYPNINTSKAGIFTLNQRGIDKLKKMEAKFGSMKINPPPYF
jgi:hypothetical protein